MSVGTKEATYAAAREERTPQGSVPQAAVIVGSPLSEREHDVLRGLGEGRLVKEIAAPLAISDGTVRAICAHIYAKLGVHGREAAVRRARRIGILARAL